MVSLRDTAKAGGARGWLVRPLGWRLAAAAQGFRQAGQPPPSPSDVAHSHSLRQRQLCSLIDLHTTMDRYFCTPALAFILALAPLCCHSFLPANSIARVGEVRNHHAHTTPLMVSSEFGGIQHAGVLVKDTKASKVTHPVGTLTPRAASFRVNRSLFWGYVSYGNDQKRLGVYVQHMI